MVGRARSTVPDMVHRPSRPTKALLAELLVRPGASPGLADRSTKLSLGFHKEEAAADLEDTKLKLDLLQQRLYAEGRRSVLLVLQAMDAAGKDGTIRHILSGLNPAGVKVSSFKAPAGPEAHHDYLWRVHQVCPSAGELGVFNRSHYEDVLVARVKDLVPEDHWRKRYRHIREFERMLHDEGTTVVKCFLHVSKPEQADRLQERIDDPEKRWKFRAADLDDRKLWAEYTAAYEEAIHETSTSHAPWYVVPADRNWVRNLAVARILLHHLDRLDPQIPAPEPGLDHVKVV
jgi:PPK2 family polyphosphate:nucleotide phosphotransferase